MSHDTAGESVTKRPFIRHARLWIFIGLLALALIGMAVTQTSASGGWEYWIFVMLAYAGADVWMAWRVARRKHTAVWSPIRRQVLHWFGLLITLNLFFMLEQTDVMSREAVSDASLLVLALTCFLAGVHFDWVFLLLGVVLAIMAVALAYVEQSTVWFIMIPVCVLAGYVVFKRRHKDTGAVAA